MPSQYFEIELFWLFSSDYRFKLGKLYFKALYQPDTTI